MDLLLRLMLEAVTAAQGSAAAAAAVEKKLKVSIFQISVLLHVLHVYHMSIFLFDLIGAMFRGDVVLCAVVHVATCMYITCAGCRCC